MLNPLQIRRMLNSTKFEHGEHPSLLQLYKVNVSVTHLQNVMGGGGGLERNNLHLNLTWQVMMTTNEIIKFKINNLTL